LQLGKGGRLGPYEIVAPLGAGGMGEVYRARDTRLGRTVAIKVLPAEFSGDPNRQLRFRREAKAISSLNHPNICALYDIGEMGAEGSKRQYLVMEYLEGETLEERVKRGPLPIDQTVRYALDIAEALDRAHRAQILHRDLKPSNVMITKSGARLFDFGLAKSLSSEFVESGGSTANTSEKPITVEGAVVGTPEYMAPEQLQGVEPDARTDVFSFGVCLYEMVTGKRPFQGTSRAGLIASILEHEPPAVSTFQPGTPASLEWLVKNCLAKDPDERIQTAHDVKLELKRISEEMRASPAAESVPRFQPRKWVYGSTALTAIVIVAATAVLIRQTRKVTSAKGSIKRFSISLPATAPLAEGPFEKLAVSPDGTRLVYTGGNDLTRLYLYSVDTRETKPLEGTEGGRGPFFSPNGEWIGFYTVEQGLKKIALAGGPPMLLSAERDLRGASWGPDNSVIFAESVSTLRRISASGGRSEALAPNEPLARWPSFLPGGESFLFTASDFSGNYENAKLAIHSLKSGKSRVVLNGATYARYVPSGYLVYLHAQAIYTVPFDLRQMRVTGSPALVIPDVDSYFTAGLAHFAVSPDGSIFYLPRDTAESERELLWVDRSGKSTPVTTIRRAYQQAKLSPEGKRVLVTAGLDPQVHLWLYDIPRDTWTRVTTEASNDEGIWSPDGKQIAFASTQNGGFDLYTMPSDGSAPPQRITARRSWDFPTSWSPDGTAIAVVEQYRATFNDIFVVAPRERAIPTPFLATPFDERDPVFSPDGHWIAYRSNESGRDEIYVQSYPRKGRKWLVSTSGGTSPVWRGDGTELFYRHGNKMMSVATQLRPEFSAARPQMLFQGEFEEKYDVTADGQRFVMIKSPPRAARTQINVILGFFDNLKRSTSK
jgi:serine/threonine-protein kinase